MRCVAWPVSLLVLAAVALSQAPGGRKQRVRLLVSDKNGYLSDLKPENIKAKSGNERPVVERLESEENEPAAVAILINDRIFSDADELIASKFVQESNPSNEYCVIASNSKAEVLLDWNGDRAALASTFRRFAEIENNRARSVVFDALALAVQKLSESRLKKKVIQVFGFGYDSYSKTKFSAVKDLLRNSDVLVDGIAVTDDVEWYSQPRDEKLDKITEMTGGHLWIVHIDSRRMYSGTTATGKWEPPEIRQKPPALVRDPRESLAEFAKQLADATRLTYLLELSPVRSPEKLDLDVEIRNAKGDKRTVYYRYRILPN